MAITALPFSVGYKAVSGIFLAFCIVIQLGLWVRAAWLMKQSISRVPGPRLAAWSRLWIANALASGRCHEKFLGVNVKYGPVARIGPNHVVTDDPNIVRRILSTKSGYVRGPWFDSLRMDPSIPTIISERDGKKHQAIRAKMAPSFSGKAVAAMEPVMDELVLYWLDSLRSRFTGPAQRPCDIGKSVEFLTVDIITKLCFGKEVGCTENDCDVYGLLETIETGSQACQHFSVFLEMNAVLSQLAKIPVLRRLVFPDTSDKAGVGRLMGIVQEVAEDRSKDGQCADDIISSLLRRGMSKEQINSNLIIALAAGSDTSATAIQSTLLCIVTNPQVYATLRSEIWDATVRGQVSTPIQDSEAKQLAYLQACVLEGLRQFPPLSQLRERVIPPGGDTLGPFHLPEGTFVGINMWGMQLNKDIYGQDADIFRPERWLTDDNDQLEVMYQTHGLIFNYGSTKCLGMSMAMMQITKVVFELLRNFDIAIADPHKPWSSVCWGIFFQKDFNVRLSQAADHDTKPPAYEHAVRSGL